MAVGKNVFTVYSAVVNPRNGQHYYTHLECNYPSLELLVSDLNDGLIVAGSALFTRGVEGERGLFEVVDRRPCAVGRAGVSRIKIPRVRFVEYEDEAAAA